MMWRTTNQIFDHMKKALFTIAAGAALILAGCNKEADNAPEQKIGKTYTIKATVENPATRSVASLNESTDKYDFSWEEGEIIGVIPDGDPTVLMFNLVEGSDDTFTYDAQSGEEYTSFGLAVTPYDALQLEDGDDFSYVSGTDVNYYVNLGGSYTQGQSNAVMVAGAPETQGDGTQKFSFKHLAALVRVTYENIPEGVAFMEFTTPDHPITGLFHFTTVAGAQIVAGDFPAGVSDPMGEASVILPEYTGTIASADFYLPIPTGSYSTFNVRLVNEDMNTIPGSQKTFSTSSPFTVSRADVVECPKITLSQPQSYRIVFGKETNQNGSPLSSTTLATTVISEGRDYVTTHPFFVSVGNAYYGDGSITSIRAGKSKNPGTINITLSPQGSVCASKIVVNCKQMDGGANAGTLSVNGATAQDVPATAGNLTYTFNDVDITEIELAASLSTFIYSIEVTYKEKQPVTLSFGDQTSFEITQGDSFTPPTLSTSPAGLTVTYASSNPAVATVDASTGDLTLTGEAGSTTITATFAGDDTYSSGSASYTLSVIRAMATSIAQIKQDLGGSTTSMSFTVSLTNAVVTRKFSDYIAYIQDESAGIYVTDAENLEQGDSYSGTVTGEMVTSNNQPKITSIDVSQATKQTGVSLSPEVVTIADITSNMSNYDGKLCKVVKAKAESDLVTGQNKSILISQGENSMTFFTRPSFGEDAIVSGNYYDIIGIPCKYNSTNELVVLSTSDVSESVINWVLSGISVKTSPSKLSYTVGEFFNPAGLVLSTVEMDSEDSNLTRIGEDVPYASNEDDFTFNPGLQDALTVANTSVTITYNGKSASLDITVAPEGTDVELYNASFEENSAHRTSGNNSYTTNSYTVSGVDWTLTNADAVTSGTPLSGDANIMARVAKNTKNSPIALTGNLLSGNKTITKLTFLSKLGSNVTLTVQYSVDGSTWNTVSAVKDASVDANNGYSATIPNVSTSDFRLKFSWSVTSSTNSHRDSQLDDVIVYGR